MTTLDFDSLEKFVVLSLEEDVGKRADIFIMQRLSEFSRTMVQQMFETGLVQKQNKSISKGYKINKGDEIVVFKPMLKTLEVVPQDIDIDIVYQDKDVVVINKPKGMVVHPAAGNFDKTLVNALLFHCGDELSGINGIRRPGIVHRIDKDTSGLLVVAKNDIAHVELSKQLENHSMTREYIAVVVGTFKESFGTINKPIGRDKKDRKKFCVTEQNSKKAVTHYRVIAQNERFSVVALKLETGRTHQIRVHLSSIMHPLVGDEIYGGKSVGGFFGQCLHAKTLGFIHPTTKQYIEFNSELPEYFKEYLKTINIEVNNG